MLGCQELTIVGLAIITRRFAGPAVLVRRSDGFPRTNRIFGRRCTARSRAEQHLRCHPVRPRRYTCTDSSATFLYRGSLLGPSRLLSPAVVCRRCCGFLFGGFLLASIRQMGALVALGGVAALRSPRAVRRLNARKVTSVSKKLKFHDCM